MNRMIDHIAKRSGVYKSRKWLHIDGRDTASARFLIYPPKCLEMPIGKIEKKWLGICVQHFKKTLNIYKGAVFD
jgi:hypothetical protein